MVYAIVFLPFTVPDEQVHFASAYKISNYFLLKFKQFGSEEIIMRASDVSFFSRSDILQNANYYRTIQQQLSLFCQDRTLSTVNFPTAEANAPFGYIASGFGIAFARIINLGPVPMFYFGRLTNILAYAGATYYAIKKIPCGKMAIFAVSVLPMTLHLLGSFSYDALAIAFAILYISQVVYMKNKETAITRKEILLSTLFGVALAPTKVVYAPILLFALIIPKEKFGEYKKSAWINKAIIILPGIFFLVALQGIALVNVATQEVGGSEKTELYTIGWALKNVTATIKIFIRTLFEKSEMYLTTLVGSSLGWFQINITIFFYLPFYMLMLYCFIKRDVETVEFNTNEKIWSLCLFVVVVLAVMSSMFFAWTPMGSGVIEGVQGRYFLPALLLLYPLTANKFVTAKQSGDKYIVIFVLFWHLFVAVEYFTRSFV